MKILKLFLFTATIFTLSSCSSDDDGNSSVELTNANLAGTYEITFIEGSSQSSVTATDGSTVVVETETYSGDTFTNAIIVFDAAGTYSVSGSFVETYTTTVTGQSSETDEEIVILSESGSYSTNNTIRTITIDGEINDVTLFDGTNFRFTSTYTETFEGFTEEGQEEIRLIKLN